MEFQWIPFSWPLLSALSPKLLTAVPWPSFLFPPISTECQKWSILAHIFFYSMYFFDILPINLSVCIYAEWCDKNPHSFTMGNILPFSTQFLPNMVMQQKMHTEFSAIRLIHFRWCSKIVIIEIYFIFHHLELFENPCRLQ